MKYWTALSFVSTLLALCASIASAQAASPYRGLDRSFGYAGIATVVLPTAEGEIEDFTVTADGRSYVLEGSLLLALQSNGQPSSEFGESGKTAVAPAVGVPESANLAVDSQGRLLIAGSADPGGRRSHVAYVIRVLSTGARDATFGGDGEVDTKFALPARAGPEGPSLQVGSLFVDARDRPIVGGSFEPAASPSNPANPCEYSTGDAPNPFVGRLTISGEIDKTFGRAGSAVLKGQGHVTSLAQLPTGGLAVFRRHCPGPPRPELQPQLFSVFTESGKVRPPVRKQPLAFSYVSSAIDPRGRIVELESPPPVVEGPDALVRYSPNGRIDSSFGRHGRVVLRRGLPSSSAFAVDSRSRPIVAGVNTGHIGLARFLPNGKLDSGFGPRGRLKARSPDPSVIALDALDRIYTVSWDQRSTKTIIRVARFIPGA